MFDERPSPNGANMREIFVARQVINERLLIERVTFLAVQVTRFCDLELSPPLWVHYPFAGKGEFVANASTKRSGKRK
jgi:hypothetical protein